MKVLFVLDHPYGAGASENVPHNRSYTAAACGGRHARRAWRGPRGRPHRPGRVAAQVGRGPGRGRLPAASHGGRPPRLRLPRLVGVHAGRDQGLPRQGPHQGDRVLRAGQARSVHHRDQEHQERLAYHGHVDAVVRLPLDPGQPATSKVMFRGTFRKIGVKKLRWFSAVDPAGKTLEARQRQLQKTETQFAGLFS